MRAGLPAVGPRRKRGREQLHARADQQGEPFTAEAVRDGLRLEAIASDIAADGDTALELLSVNSYDIAVLDRDVPGPNGDEVARQIVASDTGLPIITTVVGSRLGDRTPGIITRFCVAGTLIALLGCVLFFLSPIRYGGPDAAPPNMGEPPSQGRER
ncbi:hypothetical protein QQ658_00740 [Propionimicrobium sp. PCR01-08-3]|nr:response regulator [Propionimicrobium sp. PCR01-08-3]WIY82923.1 hypothetical protein QQ658_00740 [Propionimicrobium sp. PCR01-08-3]